jgi:gamma-glutamyltranspeptidase / glutathione hydrolase
MTMRDFHAPGRSPVFCGEAMAATSHPLATLAAVESLREGGTAADAAIAAVATLCVVEPQMTGIGGDCFCLVAKPGAPVWGYNGSGRTSANMRIERLLNQGVSAIGIDGIHGVTVPGAVEAWDAILEAHGRFDLGRALRPAIRYAENGFAVAPRVAFDWEGAAPRLARNPAATRHFLPGGSPPQVGQMVRFPALAKTLDTIARNGARAFYEGPIAEDVVATAVAHGSVLSAEDLAMHQGEVVEPIAIEYRGLDVVELPPNGQGLTALVLLNILERFNLSGLDPLGPERMHLALEAARLAYAVRDTHIAEPSAMMTEVEALLDKQFAASLAEKIDPSQRSDLPLRPYPGDTVYVTVVDRNRTAVSLINSLFSVFGVAIATEKTGIMLHNRGSCFVLDPAHPNAIGPSKRPMHTIIPALAMRSGRCDLSFGVMGAHYQPMGHAHVITNMIDYGMDVQAAIDFPRVFFEGDDTLVERGVPQATRTGLAERGHNVAVRPSPHGGGQAIRIDWERGLLIGGSDPRKDGCALGY